MTVSKAVVPLLTGSAASDFARALNSSHIKPYSNESRLRTDEAIEEALKKKRERRV